MSVGHKIIYIPIGKDARGVDLLSPIYLPIVVDDPQTVYATGSLSDEDFISTLKLYNLKPNDLQSAAGNEVGGFPLAPIIAALAPIAIPPLITAAKKLFGSRADPQGKKSNGMYGDDEEMSGYIPTNPNIKNLKQLQVLYDKYN